MRTKVHFIMPAHNLDEEARSKLMVPSILGIMNTMRVPFKITIVDDCSPGEETWEYLKMLYMANPTVFKNARLDKRRGFSDAVNAGWSLALKGDTEFIGIISTDVFVYPGWWEPIQAVFDKAPEPVGLVLPASSERSGRHWVGFNDGVKEFEEVLYAPFYLPIFRREMIEEIGPLDSSVDPIMGCGSSDCDYMIRTMDTKWRMYISRFSFCKHIHHATMKKMDLWQEYADHNLRGPEAHKALINKWGVESVRKVLKTIWTPYEGEKDEA